MTKTPYLFEVGDRVRLIGYGQERGVVVSQFCDRRVGGHFVTVCFDVEREGNCSFPVTSLCHLEG